MSINPQPLPSADWSNGHRQITIFFLNLLSWLLRGSSCLTDLTQSTKVLLPLEANKICVSIAAKICRQVKPEFPLSPMDDNYMYPINRLLPLGNKGLEIFGKTWECNLPKIHPPELHVLLDLINCVCCWYSKLCPLFCFFFSEMVANAKADTCALLRRMFTFEFLTQLLLDRFVDISVDVRVECVKRAKEFLKHHPDLVTDVTGDFFWLICYLLNTTMYNTMKLLLNKLNNKLQITESEFQQKLMEPVSILQYSYNDFVTNS